MEVVEAGLEGGGGGGLSAPRESLPYCSRLAPGGEVAVAVAVGKLQSVYCRLKLLSKCLTESALSSPLAPGAMQATYSREECHHAP